MPVLTRTDLHNIPVIHECMKESWDAYKTTCPSSDQCLRFSGRYDGQVTIRKTPTGQALVAFRGSESWKDWLINLSRYQSDYPHLDGARVHTGFLRQHDALWQRLVSHLQTYVALESRGILVTGHSLGGALATLFAVRIARLLPSVSVACYVFCSPRVGNRAFVEGGDMLDNLSFLRMNNAYDLVPHVPIYGYMHTRNVVTLPFDRQLWWFQATSRHSIKRMYQRFQRARAYIPSSYIY